jgi:hypothetical protein
MSEDRRQAGSTNVDPRADAKQQPQSLSKNLDYLPQTAFLLGPNVARPQPNEVTDNAPAGLRQGEASVSGFRATASTLLNEIGRWNPDASERQLAHMEKNDVRGAYMHAAGVLERACRDDEGLG